MNLRLFIEGLQPWLVSLVLGIPGDREKAGNVAGDRGYWILCSRFAQVF